MSIKAIVFDFDGTMLDTEGAIYESWVHIYERHGLEFPMSAWERVVGAPAVRFDPYDDLEKQVGSPISRDELRKIRLDWQQRRIESLSLQPGVQETIDAALERGTKLAIASNSQMPWVEGHLKRLGLFDHFEAICTVEQVANPKPAPDLYRLAVERLGVSPREAVAVEDSPIGALSAVRAGLHTIVVPIPLTRAMEFPPECIVIESLADMSIDQLLSINT